MMMNKEELDAKLLKMGVKKVSLDSNLYIQMLAIFGSPLSAEDAQKIIRDMRTEYERKICNLRSKESYIESKVREIKELEESLCEKEEMLMEMETAEARDRVRLLMLFEKKAEVDNSYQQTEYIKGLGNILGGVLTSNKR